MGEPHSMRITSGGRMEGYVTFALSFLRDNDRPLVLHTLPASNPQHTSSKTNGTSSLQRCTISIPRLVSTVEAIKRQYKGELYQYTESGVLPSPVESLSLERVLAGRTKPKMTHKVYMKVTLSTKPIGLEEGRNVTCQHVGGVESGGGDDERKKEDGGGENEEAEGGPKESRNDGEEAEARAGASVPAKRKSDASPALSKRPRAA